MLKKVPLILKIKLLLLALTMGLMHLFHNKETDRVPATESMIPAQIEKDLYLPHTQGMAPILKDPTDELCGINQNIENLVVNPLRWHIEKESHREIKHRFFLLPQNAGPRLSWIDREEELEEEDVLDENDLHAPKREIGFHFPFESSQIYLEITDWPIMEERNKASQQILRRYPAPQIRKNRYYFFPRSILPDADLKIKDQRHYLEFTLPTGESFEYHLHDQIISGVFVGQEAFQKGITLYSPSQDFPGREQRFHYPSTELNYTGKGIWFVLPIEYNHDFTLPGNSITLRHGGLEEECEVPSEDLFIKMKSCSLFKYASDEDFEKEVLIPKCRWTIPMPKK